MKRDFYDYRVFALIAAAMATMGRMSEYAIYGPGLFSSVYIVGKGKGTAAIKRAAIKKRNVERARRRKTKA